MNPRVKRFLRGPYHFISRNLFDPLEQIAKLRALPFFIGNWRAYRKANSNPRFKVTVADIWYRAHDRFSTAGTAEGHYFFQDLWAARLLHGDGVRKHVDVGSRMDGFIAHILPFCHVVYVDVRPISLNWPNFEFRQGLITDMPFKSGSVDSLSCLHVLEHIGLGRYSDPINPTGYLAGAAELSRVLAPGGRLLIGVPVGKERLCFDAHRVFDPATVAQSFSSLKLNSFSLIDDYGREIIENATFDLARKCEYGCGLFVFEKTGTN